MKTANFIDYNYDYHYFYDDELYPKRTRTSWTPTTSSIILDPPPRS